MRELRVQAMPNQIDAGRRSLLRGRISPPTQLLPPWAINRAAFFDVCTRCGDCQSACPEHIIVSGSGGFPTLDFHQGECTFCETCVDHCHPGALNKELTQAPWHQLAVVGNQCLAHNKVVCRSCGEACEPEAITFRIQAQGISMPLVDNQSCTGCGACVAICPTQAIEIQPVSSSHSGVNRNESAIAVC